MTVDLADFDPADWAPDLPECDGTGLIYLACRGNHPWQCGGDECEDGEQDCPGCPRCETRPVCDDHPDDHAFMLTGMDAGVCSGCGAVWPCLVERARELVGGGA